VNKLLVQIIKGLTVRIDLKTISRFAQLEYKYGDAERGKTLFEGIIDSHPKRWDMWSVYMDMEGTQNNIQSLRYVFYSAGDTSANGTLKKSFRSGPGHQDDKP
jgi:rRNA biogenesis protein RRP5